MKTYKEKRPWGSFQTLTKEKKSTVKILTLKPKQRFSLQYHKHREEFWLLLDNPMKITIGKKTFRAKKGDTFFVKKKQLHRAQALKKQARILEISFGKFNEKDIVRLEDDYNRI